MLQFLRELHFIEVLGGHEVVDGGGLGLQFLRELHFIEVVPWRGRPRRSVRLQFLRELHFIEVMWV